MSVESIAEDLGLILPKEVLFEYWCVARGLIPPFRAPEARKSSFLSQRSLLSTQFFSSDHSVYDTLSYGGLVGGTNLDWALHTAYHFFAPECYPNCKWCPRYQFRL